MSQALLRGLRLLETVDFNGPLSISALARRLGVDKATASRMVASCEPEGWLVRDADGVRIGPRAALLGQDAAAGRALRAAEPLVHAICGVTGVLTQAVGLVGQYGVVLASAGTGGERVRYGLTTRFPLWLTAVGKTIAAQLEPAQLDRLLPETFSVREALGQIASDEVLERFAASLDLTGQPGVDPAGTTLANDRAALDAQLAVIRRDRVFVDQGELLAQTSCIAVPWPVPGMPAALSAIGAASTMTRHAALIERVLRAAAAEGASRESIVAAAAVSQP